MISNGSAVDKTVKALYPKAKETVMPVDATLPYDEGNIFARILRGEIPSKRVYEDEHALAFHDINPLAPTHILVIPKGAYVSWDDFSARASDAEIAGFVRAVGKVARAQGLVAPGYRLLANAGPNSGQEVPHLHVHIFSGRGLGPMLAR
jgi:diadenosine tetraphosphate (Ap4A) HIT family hydrolase